MPAKQKTGDDQRPRRVTRQTKVPTVEPTPDDSGTISGSPTPTWSRGLSPSRLKQNAPAELEEEQVEEDEFMPSTREVAETLATMRSRDNNANRGHEVSCTQLGSGERTHNFQ